MFGFFTLFNHQDYSPLEDRNLAQFSQLVSKNPYQKEYYDYISEAFSDQVEARDAFVNQYFYFNTQILKQKYVNDTIVGKDDVLFESPFRFDGDIEEEIHKIANLVNDQADQMEKYGSKLIYISYTRKDAIMYRYLPSFYNNYHDRFIEYNRLLKSLLNDNVIFVDLLDLLTDDQIYYYQGDHHLNIYGQEIVFNKLNQLMSGNANPIYQLSDYELIPEQIEGSFARRLGYQTKRVQEDLYLYPKTFQNHFQRYENGKKSELPIMNENKKYACFMSGDRGETRINNLDAKKDFKILFSGSSYLNSLEYLYIPSVSSFISLDYRHNKNQKTVVDYVKEYKPQYVIYTASASDTSYSYKLHQLHFGLNQKD